MRMRAYSMRWQRIRAWLPAGSRSQPRVLVPKCIQAPKLSSANLNPRAQATQATQSRPEHRLAHAGGPSACHTDTQIQQPNTVLHCALSTAYPGPCVPPKPSRAAVGGGLRTDRDAYAQAGPARAIWLGFARPNPLRPWPLTHVAPADRYACH